MPFKHGAREITNVIFEKGEYDATIKKATPKRSKKGNEMLELIVTVFGPQDQRTDVFDYLIDGDKTAWKVRDFCQALGIDYEAGEIDERKVEGSSITVLLGVDPPQNGYPEKNKIVGYVAYAGSRPSPTREFHASDEDVPF